jgi:hypothetical protein
MFNVHCPCPCPCPRPCPLENLLPPADLDWREIPIGMVASFTFLKASVRVPVSAGEICERLHQAGFTGRAAPRALKQDRSA